MVNTHTLLTLWVSIELLNVQENDTGVGWDSTGHITFDTRSFPTPWTTLWRCPQIGLSETECKIEINWFYSNQCLREIEFPCKKALFCVWKQGWWISAWNGEILNWNLQGRVALHKGFYIYIYFSVANFRYFRNTKTV